MKFFKYTVLALALAVGFTACSDDDDYVPGAASSGVYFPTDDALEVALDRNVPTFDVIVSRLGDTAAATYGLTGSADEEVFTLPTSVSFAAGETSTIVKVAYNGGNMAMDKAYKVVLGFAPGTTIANYGYESIEMSVTLPAPWKTVGKGMYQDLLVLPCYFELDEPGRWECELQQHEVDPTRFRWVHPYGDNFAKWLSANDFGEADPSQYDSKNELYIEFIADAEGNVLIPYQPTGVTINADEGMLYVCNLAGMYYTLGQNSFETILGAMPEAFNYMTWGKDKDEDGNEIDVVNTIFQGPGLLRLEFSPNPSSVYSLTNDPGGYNWWREGVEIKDYDISIVYKGVLTTPEEDSFAIADIELGADIKKAKAGLVLTADLEEAIEAVRSDAVETVELDKAENIGTQFNFSGSGDYVLAVVAYNEEGNEVSTQALAFFVADTSAPKEWNKLGQGVMVDAWMLPAFSQNGMRVDPMNSAYYVNIEENIENPGVYRIKAPWTEGYPASNLNENTELKPDVVVDARDPNFVTMAPQYSGFNMQGYFFWVSSIADAFVSMGNSQQSIIAAGYANTFAEGEIEIFYPTWTNTADATTAPPYCGKSWYDEESPYSETQEACPGYFVLPSAVNASMAKIHMKHTADNMLPSCTAARVAKSYNLKFNLPKTLNRKANLGKKVQFKAF